MKKIIWTGATKRDLISLGQDVCARVGFELFHVQMGREPADWKPMPEVGAGVKEIRVKIKSGAYRAIYIATSRQAVYVLNVFNKKTQRTPKREIDLAKNRLRRIAK